MRNFAFYLTTIFFLICLPLTSIAQDQERIDSLFDKAKELAITKEFAKAEKLCIDILALGDDGDVRFYLGLLYSWDGKYNEARRELSKSYQSTPNSEEVIIAMANNELWSGNPQTSLDILNKALTANPNNEKLLYLKAKALYDLKRYNEAIAALNQLLKINPYNEDALHLLSLIKIGQLKNALMADANVDFFDNQGPWYLGYLQYNRKVSFGTIIGRVNYAHRFSMHDFQFEADAYPKTGKNNYLYLNAGVSGAKLFPKYRFGSEFFQTFPHGFEASLGLRYMKFSIADAWIYTGSISKYFGDYWLSFRPYIAQLGNKFSYTEVYQARRYFNDDPDTYVGLQYTHGSSPDDIHIYLSNADRLKLTSDEIKLTGSKRFHLTWIGIIRLAYAREEYIQFQNRYSLEVSLQRLF